LTTPSPYKGFAIPSVDILIYMYTFRHTTVIDYNMNNPYKNWLSPPHKKKLKSCTGGVQSCKSCSPNFPSDLAACTILYYTGNLYEHNCFVTRGSHFDLVYIYCKFCYKTSIFDNLEYVLLLSFANYSI